MAREEKVEGDHSDHQQTLRSLAQDLLCFFSSFFRFSSFAAQSADEMHMRPQKSNCTQIFSDGALLQAKFATWTGVLRTLRALLPPLLSPTLLNWEGASAPVPQSATHPSCPLRFFPSLARPSRPCPVPPGATPFAGQRCRSPSHRPCWGECTCKRKRKKGVVSVARKGD